MSLSPVCGTSDVHTLHSYFNVSPESPDGRFVLYYSSAAVDGHVGELRLLERATGVDSLVCSGVTTEDAHRGACQQWVGSDGRFIAWHDCRGDEWVVCAMEVATRATRVLATGRQLGFGTVRGRCVMLYGCHWNPRTHRGLETADVETGEVAPLVSVEALLSAHGAFVAREFGSHPVSLFFPVAAPDGGRLFFKIAAGAGGSDFRSPSASHRQGLVFFDVHTGRVGALREAWGHPAWLPDSTTLIEMEDVTINSSSDGDGDNAEVPLAHNFPHVLGSHPAVSPDGRWLAKDGELPEDLSHMPGEWGVLLCCLNTGMWRVIVRSAEDRGATSWRRNHPHPVFSADSARLYFNLNNERCTRLWVAEVGATATAGEL
jgi:hypothetical protein